MSITFHNSSSDITNFASEPEAFLIAPCMFFAQHFHTNKYRLMKAVMEQPKNCPFGANKKIELKNVTTASDKTGTLLSPNISR